MQALILVGGEGTRLRPLTSTIPKPVVPLVDRPFMAYMLEWLASHGVEDVVMSCGFMAAGVRDVLGDGEVFGVRLRYVEEPVPLGTAGALKLAEPLLGERFFMLNGDVLTDLDLSAQLAQHEATGATGTLALIGVEDPSAYGLVRLAEGNAVREFLEKPSAAEIDTNMVSAGAYVFERAVLDLIEPGRNVSIEREVFPRLIGRGLYGYPGSGYWMDIGTPARYLQATFEIMEGVVDTRAGARLGAARLCVAGDAQIAGSVAAPALIERGVSVAAGAEVGPLAVLAADVSIGPGTRVERSVVLPGARIGAGCTLSGCVIGAGVSVGDRTTIGTGVVLGAGVSVGADNALAGGMRVFPGVSLPDGAIKS